jgi:hypothetical protein
MALEIASLSAVAAFAIANEDDSVTALPRAAPETTIWDAKAAQDAAGGCLGPVAFQLGAKFTLRMTGSVKYPIEWVTPVPCHVVGTIQSASPNPETMAVLQGKWEEKSLPPPKRDVEEERKFDVLLELTGPLVDKNLTSFLPFAILGAVEWTLEGGLGTFIANLKVYLTDDIHDFSKRSSSSAH